MTDEPARPDPDALLAQLAADAAAARRGRLKIFFGAAPGVGKTFAMLGEARQLRIQGRELVVGIAETHGRSETAVLLEGLEQLPRQAVVQGGVTRTEFDLDAALARHPALLLVDELAHTNAPGSRHPKRWQDVEELLAAGIDVWTTVNVQHVESLNDIVGGITGIRVRETVPDRIFAAADEIVLVDLPPDDLLARLREGKVYVPDQAERAIQNFFRKGNLIALRELALRLTAERVDAQIRAFRRATAAVPVWPTGEALLACVGPGNADDKVVRAAARLAAGLNCRWHAVYAETPALQHLPGERRRAILNTLKLAQELGAETATLPAQDAVDALLAYARTHNLGRILVGRSVRPRIRVGRRPFAQRLGVRAPDIDIIAVARADTPARATEAASPMTPAPGHWPGYSYAALVSAAITVVVAPLAQYLDLVNSAMLFLLGVVVAAYRWGRGPAALAALLNVAAFDFFLVPPQLTFAVSDAQYVVVFAVMLITGLVIGHLTAGLRYQVEIAHQRERRARSLSDMARELSSALVEAQVVETSNQFVGTGFRAQTTLLLPDSADKLQLPAAHPHLPNFDLAIAQWSYDRNLSAGAGTDTLPASAQFYQPLKAPMRVRGVLVVEPSDARQLLIPEQRRLLETFAALIAIALERIHFVTVTQDTLIRMESERLRSSLLTALSHDLRTPLTALVGMAETLALDLTAAESVHADRADVIREQAQRTGRLVDNLLEMARLQSGAIRPRRDWLALEEIVAGALQALEPMLANHRLQTELPADLPLLQGDAVMLERVLVNLLDNAAKYTPADTVIGVTARANAGTLEVSVWDAGPGLPPGQEQALFERFARGQRESSVPGLGLGLAICQAIVEAHGGRIRAENRPQGGARFVFTLPLAPPPAPPEEEPSSTPTS